MCGGFWHIGPRKDLEDSTIGRLGKHSDKRSLQSKISPMPRAAKT